MPMPVARNASKKVIPQGEQDAAAQQQDQKHPAVIRTGAVPAYSSQNPAISQDVNSESSGISQIPHGRKKRDKEAYGKSSEAGKAERAKRKVYIRAVQPEEIFSDPSSRRNSILLSLLCHTSIGFRISHLLRHHRFANALIQACYGLVLANVLVFQGSGRLPSDWIAVESLEKQERAALNSALSLCLYVIIYVLPFVTFAMGHLAHLRSVLARRVLKETYTWIALVEISGFCIAYCGTFCWSRGGMSVAFSLWMIGMFAVFYDALSPTLRKRKRWQFVWYSGTLSLVCVSLFLRQTPGICFAPLKTAASPTPSITANDSIAFRTDIPQQDAAAAVCSVASSSGDGDWFTSNDILSRLASHFGLELIDIALGRAASIVFLLAKLLFTAFRRDSRQCSLIVSPVRLVSVFAVPPSPDKENDENAVSALTKSQIPSGDADGNRSEHKLSTSGSRTQCERSPIFVTSKSDIQTQQTEPKELSSKSGYATPGNLHIDSDAVGGAALMDQTGQIKHRLSYLPAISDARSTKAPLPDNSDSKATAQPMKLIPAWNNKELNNAKCISVLLGDTFAKKYLKFRRGLSSFFLVYSVTSTLFYTFIVIPFLLTGAEARRIMWSFSLVLMFSLFDNFLCSYNYELVRKVTQKVDFWFALVKCIQLMAALSGVFCLRPAYAIFFFGLGCGFMTGCFLMDALPLQLLRAFRVFAFLIMTTAAITIKIVISGVSDELDCLDVRVSPFGGAQKTPDQECMALRHIRLGHNGITLIDVIMSRTFSWKEMVVSSGLSVCFMCLLQMFTGILDTTRLAMIESPMMLIEDEDEDDRQ